MNGTLMNIYQIILIILPPVISAPLFVYFITEVLRYRMRRIKTAYFLALATGVFSGLIYAFVSHDTAANAISMHDIVLLLASLLLLIFSGFNMIERRWVRFFVVFFSMDILTDLNSIFGGLKNQIYSTGVLNGNVGIVVTQPVMTLPILSLPAIFQSRYPLPPKRLPEPQI